MNGLARVRIWARRFQKRTDVAPAPARGYFDCTSWALTRGRKRSFWYAVYLCISCEGPRAIRPRRGMIYTVSFWARAEKAGKALFQWTAYRNIQPFVDAASPGSLPCAVDREWRPYTCSVREGLDFFAEDSRFLLLTFHATSVAAQEQTLWIDDVRVTEQADPHPVALMNAATIPHAALEHRLRPGDRLEFTVNATDRLRRATTDTGGVSFHRVCGWTGQPYNSKLSHFLIG